MQDPILVSGCARSGTSLVAQILHACGAWKGETVAPDPASNPDGFFEHIKLREEVNKEILRSNGCDPLGVKDLPDPDSLQYPTFKSYVASVIKEEGYAGGPWLFKDAKLAYTHRLWMREFPKARWVLTRRNPMAIISSCLRTHFMKQHSGDPNFWMNWVNQTTEQLEEITNKYGALLVDTDELVGGDLTMIKAAVEALDLEWDEDKVRQIIKPQHWKSKDINTSIPLNTPHEVIDKQVWHSCRRAKRAGVKNVGISQPHQGEIAIVGGGPSIKRNWQQIRDMQKAGVYILALNGAHNFLKKKKIIPNGCAVMDARESNKKFVQFPHKDCTYFLSSQCHPALFDIVEKKKAAWFLWHNDVGAGTERIVDVVFGRRTPVVPTLGTTIGIRAMWLAHFLGFRRFHVFGLDSCLGTKSEHHAYEQKENDGQQVVPLCMETPAGKYEWPAHTWMIAQVQDFKMWCEAHPDVQWNVVDCPPLQALLGKIPPNKETYDAGRKLDEVHPGPGEAQGVSASEVLRRAEARGRKEQSGRMA